MGGRSGRKAAWNVHQKTVPGLVGKDFGTVLLFCILLPYVLLTFLGKTGRTEGLEKKEDIFVLCETESGTEKIPEDTFLTGALAASIPLDMEDETMKAQAVVLRTQLLEKFRAREDKTSDYVKYEELDQEYYGAWKLRQMWGGQFEQRYARLKGIVDETDGIVITYQGILIKAAYFYASAGKTRDGNEIFGQDSYPYLKSVDCVQDFTCPDYSREIIFPEKLFQKKLGGLFGAASDAEEANTPVEIKCVQDGAGYVRTVTCAGQTVSGEKFREAFGLPSACFTLEEHKDGVAVTVKGTGHGVGMSQYGADQMAKQGKSYDEILKYFFTGTEIQKN